MARTASFRLSPGLLSPALALALALAACASGDKADEPTDDGDGGGAEGGGDDGSEPADADADGFDETEDCDDGDASVFPGADETCDGVDEDCDGDIDEDAVDAPTWYGDADGDGYVDLSISAVACEAPEDHASDALGEDCDDADAAVFPGAEELCNEVDDDCDGEVDEDVLSTWWADADGDGYAGDAVSVEACEAPEDHLAEGGTDCDDEDAAVNPDAEEVCFNGVDDDCDGLPGSCSLEGDLAGSDASFTLQGELSTDYDGWFAAAGDVDGDGEGDVITGAPYSDINGFNSGYIHVALGPLSGVVPGASADQRLQGESEKNYAGWSVRVADQDGDGFDDLTHMAQGASEHGRAYLHYGSPSGLPTLEDAVHIDGTAWDQTVGRGLAMGDITGDGGVELLVVSNQAQTVYAYSGTLSGALTLDDAEHTIHAPDADGIFGRGIDTGDLNADGVADVAMTAPWALDHQGLVYVSYGPITGDVSTDDAGGRIEGDPDEYSSLGYANCSTAGDVDGDGHTDLLFGSYGDGLGGVVRLFLGPVSGTLAHDDHQASWTAPNATSYTGYDADLIGDTDGDGFSEILFASYNSTTQQGVVLIYGPATGTAEAHADSDARFDMSGTEPYRAQTHLAGDLNDDGLNDVLWTDAAAGGTGETYLFWGGGI